MPVSHQQARAWLIAGFERTFAAVPDQKVAQAAQGVALLETGYGQGWRGAGIGSNNMGADQAGNPPCDPEKSFLYTDTNPTSSGASIPYQVCFRKYATPESGMAGLTRIMYGKNRVSVLEAAKTGDLHAVSSALYDTHYYAGFGPSREVRIAHHYRALRSAVNSIAAALGEKMPDGFDPLVRVLKWSWGIPQHGEDVKRVQRVVGIDDDGWYGYKTKAKVRAFQVAFKGLEPDGVVGLDTWHAIQEIEQKIEEAKNTA